MKNQTCKVLGIESFAIARPIEVGDSIGVLLPEDTEVKRGDVLVKHRGADIGVSSGFENRQV